MEKIHEKLKVLTNLVNNRSCNEDMINTVKDEEHQKRSKELFKTAIDINNSTDNWKIEKKAANGDIVESKYVPGVGKFYRFTGKINFPPKKLISELFFNSESVSKWNPTILSTKRIKLIGDSTELIYIITAPAVGGLVKSRDFVVLRHYTSRQGCFMLGGSSIEHPDVPVNHQYIRGESGPGCHIATPIPGVADYCTFQWLMNSRLNGWLPQYVADMASTEVMFNYINNLRSYGDKLREQGLMDK